MLVQWLALHGKRASIPGGSPAVGPPAGANLRLLRLLALWACEVGSIAQISTQLMAVENANKWQRERLVLSHYFKENPPPKKGYPWKPWNGSAKPVYRQVICSSPGNGRVPGSLNP